MTAQRRTDHGNRNRPPLLLRRGQLRAVDEAEPPVPAALVCNTIEALLSVVLDDLGIACLPDFLVGEHIFKAHFVCSGRRANTCRPSCGSLSTMVENLFQAG